MMCISALLVFMLVVSESVADKSTDTLISSHTIACVLSMKWAGVLASHSRKGNEDVGTLESQVCKPLPR